MRSCTKCGELKPYTEFYKHKNIYNSYCKSCCQKNTTASKRLQRTGCTQELYDFLYQQQEGCCAICGKHALELKRSLAADHCHDSKKIRGLLCGSCNQGLGYFKDNQTLLLEAIAYLNRSQ